MHTSNSAIGMDTMKDSVSGKWQKPLSNPSLPIYLADLGWFPEKPTTPCGAMYKYDGKFLESVKVYRRWKFFGPLMFRKIQLRDVRKIGSDILTEEVGEAKKVSDTQDKDWAIPFFAKKEDHP